MTDMFPRVRYTQEDLDVFLHRLEAAWRPHDIIHNTDGYRFYLWTGRENASRSAVLEFDDAAVFLSVCDAAPLLGEDGKVVYPDDTSEVFLVFLVEKRLPTQEEPPYLSRVINYLTPEDSVPIVRSILDEKDDFDESLLVVEDIVRSSDGNATKITNWLDEAIIRGRVKSASKMLDLLDVRKMSRNHAFWIKTYIHPMRGLEQAVYRFRERCEEAGI